MPARMTSSPSLFDDVFLPHPPALSNSPSPELPTSSAQEPQPTLSTAPRPTSPRRPTLSRFTTRAQINMAVTTYLITGASRGLGLEFARQLLAASPENRVIAAARNPSSATELSALIAANPGRIESIKLDVSDEKSAQVREVRA